MELVVLRVLAVDSLQLALLCMLLYIPFDHNLPQAKSNEWNLIFSLQVTYNGIIFSPWEGNDFDDQNVGSHKMTTDSVLI